MNINTNSNDDLIILPRPNRFQPNEIYVEELEEDETGRLEVPTFPPLEILSPQGSPQSSPRSPLSSYTPHAPYNKVMEFIGYGWIQFHMILACGLLMMFFTCQTLGIAIVDANVDCEFKMSDTEALILKCSPFAGIAVGSTMVGYWSDSIGRRVTILSSTFWSFIVSLLSVVMPTFTIYLICRFLVGLGLGGSSFVNLIYLGELFENKHITAIFAFLFMFQGVGMAYSYGVQTRILHMNWSYKFGTKLVFTPWRLTILLLSLPALAGLILLLHLPGSPKYLLIHNKHDKGFEILNWLCKKNRAQTLEDNSIEKVFIFPHELEAKDLANKPILDGLKPILRKPFIVNFVASCIVLFLHFFVSHGVIVWFTKVHGFLNLLNEDLFEEPFCFSLVTAFQEYLQIDRFKCSDINFDHWDSMWLGIIIMFGYIVLAGFALKVPRRILFNPILQLSIIFGACLMWLESQIKIACSFFGFLTLFTISGSLTFAAFHDGVPTIIRGRAMGFAMSLCQLGTIGSLHLISYMMQKNCPQMMFSLMGIILNIALCSPLLPL